MTFRAGDVSGAPGELGGLEGEKRDDFSGQAGMKQEWVLVGQCFLFGGWGGEELGRVLSQSEPCFWN